MWQGVVTVPPLLFLKLSTATQNIIAYQHVAPKHFVSHKLFKIPRRKKMLVMKRKGETEM